jgi:hypothetical protein
MYLTFKKISILISLFTLIAMGMEFVQQTYYNNAYVDAWIPSHKLFGKRVKWGKCGRYIVKNLKAAGCRLPKHNWFMRNLKGGCHYGDVPALDGLIDQGKSFGLTMKKYTSPPENFNMDKIIQDLGGKTPHFFIWRRISTGYFPIWTAHAGKFLPGGDYAAHGDRTEQPNGIYDDFFDQE